MNKAELKDFIEDVFTGSKPAFKRIEIECYAGPLEFERAQRQVALYKRALNLPHTKFSFEFAPSAGIMTIKVEAV